MRTRGILKLLLFFLASTFLLASAMAQEAAPWLSWQSTLRQDHPLTGKIWSARDNRFVTPETLGQAVRKARFVLIGEVHDNADHHRLQAWLIERSAADKKPAVVMEMITQDQTQALRTYLAKPGANAAGLGAALEWEARGWPEWRMYRPIAETALALGLSLHAGSIARERLKTISKKGLDTLDANRRASLLLDQPLGAPLRGALLDELYLSHCELVPRDAMGAMLDIQRLRDAVLADSLLAAAGGGSGSGSAILITGNGHARADRAVPWYLSRRAPRARTVTVLLLEVDEASTAPEDLVPEGPGGEPAADYVWFTPRADREDPCEELRKRFAK